MRAKLFLIVDDHSRLLVHGRFFAHENARACQEALRQAIVRRGLPEVLYADNGAPFKNAWLTRTCAVLGIRLVHSTPYSPEGRGKQERLNRFIREAFLDEATHQGIDSLRVLDDLFDRLGRAGGQPPDPRRDRRGADRALREGRPAPRGRSRAPGRGLPLVGHPQGDPHRHGVARGQRLCGRPGLVARRVELRYDPEDLSVIDVFFEGSPAGVATPFVIGRHTHRAVPQAATSRAQSRPASTTSAWWRPPTRSRRAPGASTSPSWPCSTTTTSEAK